MGLIKNTLLVLTFLLLSACSAAKTHYQAPVQPQPTFQEQSFYQLVELVRNTHTNAPDSQTKLQARMLASDAGLFPNCINKNDCFLHYGDFRVRIDHEWIFIDSGSLHLKVQDAKEAIKIIYHQ